MLDLLVQVSAELASRGIAHAMIGAGALAVHGISRSTFDIDLFTIHRAALDAATWAAILLKLYAGSPQDAWDVQQLIAVVPDPMALVAEVERGLLDLPADAAELWRTIADRARG